MSRDAQPQVAIMARAEAGRFLRSDAKTGRRTSNVMSERNNITQPKRTYHEHINKNPGIIPLAPKICKKSL